MKILIAEKPRGFFEQDRPSKVIRSLRFLPTGNIDGFNRYDFIGTLLTNVYIRSRHVRQVFTEFLMKDTVTGSAIGSLEKTSVVGIFYKVDDLFNVIVLNPTQVGF